jgi:hypothetical protein
MAVLYISEYTEASQFAPTLGPEPALVNQAVTFTTSTQSAAFSRNTTMVRLHADTACFIKFGLNPTATTATDARMAAGQTEYFKVLPGYKVAAVT